MIKVKTYLMAKTHQLHGRMKGAVEVWHVDDVGIYRGPAQYSESRPFCRKNGIIHY